MSTHIQGWRAKQGHPWRGAMEAVALIIRGNVPGNDNVLITKGVKRASNEINVLSSNLLASWPPCESHIFTYHILSPCLPCDALRHSQKSESLSARGLRCRLAKILIGFPQEFLFTGGWLRVRSRPPPSIPKALSVYN